MLFSSQLVEDDGHLTYVEEYIMLALVGYEAGEVLSDAAVPVGSVVLVEELLD